MEIKKSIAQGVGKGELYDVLVQLQNMALLTAGKVYYVWKGGNSTTGLSWENAFDTIAGAIAAHKAYRATVPSAQQSVDDFIIIAPGLYEENITDLPYSCTMIGLGVLGTDKSTEIHPAVGSCMAGTVSGLRMYNISFQGGTGTADTLDFNICNNVHIVGCEFYPGATDSNAAISTQNCGMSVFKNNKILTQSASKYTYGFYFGGGADKYFIDGRIEGNTLTGLAATGTGIYIASDCTCSAQTIIRNNVIYLSGAGTGIDDNSDGCFVIDNYVFHTSGTPFDYNASLAAQNIANDAGTVTDQPSMG